MIRVVNGEHTFSVSAGQSVSQQSHKCSKEPKEDDTANNISAVFVRVAEYYVVVSNGEARSSYCCFLIEAQACI